MQKQTLGQSLYSGLATWYSAVSFSRITSAFFMPFVGAGIANLLVSGAPIPAKIILLSGVVAAALSGLETILVIIDRQAVRLFYEKSLMQVGIPHGEVVLIAVLLVLITGWIGCSLGVLFLVICLVLALLHSAFALLFRHHRFLGSLVLACIGVLQCVLAVVSWKRGFEEMILPAALFGGGFGLFLYFVHSLLLYRPKRPGSLRPERLMEGWLPFVMQIALSSALLAYLAWGMSSTVVFAAAACLLVFGGVSGYRTSKRQSRGGVTHEERVREASLFFGLPLASMQMAPVFGEKDTAVAAILLLVVVIGVRWSFVQIFGREKRLLSGNAGTGAEFSEG